MRKSLLLLIGFPSVLLSVAALADAHVRFNVSLTPAGSFTAESRELKTPQAVLKKNGAIEVKNAHIALADFRTGISLRDKHMAEKYFEVTRFPEAVLQDSKGENGQFTGLLNLHGVTQKINGTYEIKNDQAIAQFKTNITDYKIAQPKYMGVGVKDEVTVEAAFRVTKENE